MAEKLQVTLVIEMMGRPPEHLKEALTTLVVKLGSEKGVKVTNKIMHDPVAVKDAKDLYTAFAEVDAELDSLTNYFGIIFAYMPAHIEIVSPKEIALSNAEFSELGNRLLARLHDYDAITKRTLFERDVFMRELQKVAPHLFKKEQNSSQAPAQQTSQPETKEEEKKKARKKPKKS